MVDPSFDAEYPTLPGLAEVSGRKSVNFRFYRWKTGWNPEVDQINHNQAQTKANRWLSNQLYRNDLDLTSTKSSTITKIHFKT